MGRQRLKFKQGAASFYMVAFSTLILIIIAASFAAIIISEVTRTSNDDLSQSAYDSALAGVEDAKLAFYSYQNCLKNSSAGNCSEIIKIMENPDRQDCDMVSRILGRIKEDDPGQEIPIQESNIGNNMQQAYTCVKIASTLKDYRSTISSANQIKVIKPKFDNVEAYQISKVRISWFSNANATNFNWVNIDNDNKIIFPSAVSATIPTPPTISFAFIQTPENFTLDSFNWTVGNKTNRGMLYLVPNSGTGDYTIGTEALLKSNEKTATNKPRDVNCAGDNGNEFACSVTIELPKPYDPSDPNNDNVKRSNETFMFVAGLPYGAPATDFALEFFCEDGQTCSDAISYENDNGETVESNTPSQAMLKGVQIEIDSTGRANDLYRRVQARLEGADSASLSVMGPLELLGKGGNNDELLNKTFISTTEYNF